MAKHAPTPVSLVDRLGRNPNDSAAWREFVRYYGSTIRRWCHHWGLQQADADDVSQDLLMDVARQMQTFVYDPGRSFRAWLKTLAHGAWCDWLERRGRHVRGDADSQVLHRLQTVVARDDLVQRLEQKHDGRPFFSLECVEGGSLDQRLDGTPLAARRAAELTETLARAIEYAHQQGIVHRDLSPSNVLLTAADTPKISDFGLAKFLISGEASPTRTGTVLGTPSYMAPEQAQANKPAIGPVTDVYALGAILYELLTGRPPFKAETPLDTALPVVSQEPVPPSRLHAKVPRDLETICLKCLHKEPSKRYGSARELADDLHRFSQDNMAYCSLCCSLLS